ncbi:MAG: response regulator [Novosphingobium sp.]|nr:response regulator [Novosphingobium sp.]
MPAPKLLLVEDDTALAELVEYRFRGEGYDVRTTDDGDEALLLAAEDAPDLVLLDWMIGGTSGIEVCRRLRRNKETAHVPIIMLTARSDEEDRIRGLEIGADDYVTKPFSPRELIARVGAVLRRVRPALAGETITVGDLSLDPTAHRVSRRGTPMKVELLDAVWGSGSDIELRTVDVHIRRLRQAISIPGAADPVRTVRSAGYALEGV